MAGLPSSGRTRVADVSAVVLVHPQGNPLDDLLDTLSAQQVRPLRVLVCGLDPHGEEAAAAVAHPGLRAAQVPVIVRPALVPTAEELDTRWPRRWRTVRDALGALPVHEDTWLWFLEEDSRPEPGALRALVSAARRSSRVALVAPKLVRADDPRILLGVGHHLTVAGRPVDPAQAALVDQGQLDLRQDALAAPLAGSLGRSDLIAEVGALDPAFGSDGVEGLDLGWRLHLAGHRVVMAPEAVVRQGPAGLGVTDPVRTRMRTRQVALARGGLVPSLLRRVGIIVTSLLAALLLLLVKRPDAAREELADVRAALSPARGWGARWRFRGRRTVRPRDLRSLFLPAGAGARDVLDTVVSAMDPRRRTAREDLPGRSATTGESGPVDEDLVEIEPRRRARWWSWPLVAVLAVATGLTVWRWWGLLPAVSPGGTGVVGDHLGPGLTDATGLWHSAVDGWRGGGLGHDGPPEPWLLPAAAWTRLVELLPGATAFSAGVALSQLLLLAVPLSVLTAYVALRRATRRRWLRAGLALGYAGLLPLSAAVDEARVGPALVHVLAPLLLAGYAAASARAGGPRRAAAAFATALGATLAALWVPQVLIPSTLAGLALLLAGRGLARWRGAVLTVLPWLLLLPWVGGLLGAPVRLLGGAGATVAGDPELVSTPAWQLLLLDPRGAVDPLSWEALPVYVAALLWVAALAATALRGDAGRRAALLVAAGLLTTGLAVLLARLDLGVLPAGHPLAGAPVAPWPGALLSLAGAAVVLAAALLLETLLSTADGYRRVRAEEAPRSAGAIVVVALLVAVLVPAVSAWAAGWQAVVEPRPALAAATDPLPAVAGEQARGPAALRTLVIDPAPGVSGSSASESTGAPAPEDADPAAVAALALRADLVGAEPEPTRIVPDLARGLVATSADPTPVVEAVAALTGAAPGEEALTALEDLGVGYVQVLAADESPVVALVDRVPGLSRVSSPEGEVLWRHAERGTARVQVVLPDGSPGERLAVTGAHGTSAGSLTDVPEGAVLRIAEGSGWSRYAEVLVDGVRVQPAADGTVELPAGDLEVRVGQGSPGLPLLLLAAVLALIALFLALPFGRAETADPQEAS